MKKGEEAKIIIEDVFITKDSEEREKALQELMVRIIKTSENIQ